MLIALVCAVPYAVLRAHRYMKHKEEFDKIDRKLLEPEQEEEHAQKTEEIQAIFDGMKLDRNALLYPTLFLLRRMILVSTLIYLDYFPNVQIGVNIVSSAFMLCF